MTISRTFSLSLILSLGLVACGGGGGGAGVVSNPPSHHDNSVTQVTVPIPASPYLAGSAQSGGWNVLQTARKLCGFGVLTQNTQLDQAALAHANYLASESVRLSSTVMEHDEPNTNNPFFTGNDPLIRAQSQGYGYRVAVEIAEILASTTWPTHYGVLPTLEQSGGNAMRDLLNTVYHLQGAMYDGPDIGLGAAQQTAAQGVEFRFGALNGYQSAAPRLLLGARKLATYPCEGSSNIPLAFVPANETPNPFPTMTSTSQTVGPPIYLKVDADQTLAVNSATITRSTDGAQVATKLMTRGNDPSRPVMIGSNEAFLIPTQPLNPNSDYVVTIKGSINDTPFQTHSFTMRTGQ